MGLQKIELENFKSYNGKHVIGPFDKFTSIVGPNGSGKSNIMDAIIFTLGINSASLRTEKIKDIINVGCDTAYVEIYIDILDQITTFKRHLSRSGRSTYFFNSEVVSFEDYVKQLEDVNIFINLKNFVIFQEDINNLANKTPLELTRYIEELSGSVIFKNEYDRVLKEQKQLMNECSLIFDKKKEMLNSIRENKQIKEQEKLFKKLLEEKKELEKVLLEKEIFSGRTKIKELEDQNDVLLEVNRNLNDEIHRKEENLESSKEELFKIQKDYLFLEQELQKMNETKIMKNIELSNNLRIADSREIKLKELNALLEEKKETRKKIDEDIRREENDIRKIEEAFSQYTSRHRKKNDLGVEIIEEIQKKEEEFLKVTHKEQEYLSKIDLEIFPKNYMLETSNNKIKQIENEIRKKEREKIVEEEKGKRIQKNMKILDETMQSLRNKMEKSLEEYEQLERLEKEKNDKLFEIVGNLLRIKSEQKINLKKENARYIVNTLKTMFVGVYGMVIDLVKATQNKYEIPISIILGSHSQSVVVENESTALSCINYLKERKLCKMTFLPLNMIRGSQNKQFNESSYRSAIYVVNYNNKYRNIVNFLLSSTIVSDTLDVAKDLVYKNKLKENVCTLDGVYIQSKGRMITYNTQHTNKFEENGFSKLVEERRQILEEITSLQNKKASMSQVAIVKDRISVYEEKSRKEKEEYVIVETEIQKIQEKIDSNAKEIEMLKNKIHDMKDELAVLEEEKKKVRKTLEAKEREIFKDLLSKANYKNYEEYRNSNVIFENKKIEFENLKLEIGTRIEGYKEELEELIETINNLNAQILKLNESSSAYPSGINGNEDLEISIKEYMKVVANKKNEFENKKLDFDLKMRDLEDLYNKRKENDYLLINLETTKERINEEIKDKINFGIIEGTYDPSHENLTLNELSIEDIRNKLDEISKSINEIIPTVRTDVKSKNFDEINKEYDEIKKKTTENKKMLNEIKNKRAEKFMECFNIISKEISKIYKNISRTDNLEGNAYLVLENPSEPYLEGIKYHVMVPNKRFREICMLSGGEKSMSILALLFSFNSYKKVPFFIFDELDSALDKINIGRMIDFFIKSDVQFIIITLKPMLFQHSDSLIGVYKDPKEQVSKILTYRLSY